MMVLWLILKILPVTVVCILQESPGALPSASPVILNSLLSSLFSVVLSCFFSHTFALRCISFPTYSHTGFPIPPKIIVDKTLKDERKINALTSRISKL